MPEANRRQPTGDELLRLQGAILDAFSFTSLTRMVRFQLNEELLEIVPFVDRNFTDMVYALIVEYGSYPDGLHQLVNAAHKQNPENPQLNAVVNEFLAIDFAPLPPTNQSDKVVDLLTDLPSLPRSDLPEAPFRNILWFRRQDAPIFFGRGSEIRDLYRRITATDGDSIILYYGQSGVGKTSLLEAGLIPRLEQVQSVAYARRDQTLGLVGTLAGAIASAGCIESPGRHRQNWLGIETVTGKPFTVLLDQVEEVYTRPSDAQPGSEMDAFLDALDEIFYQPDMRPVGRLILSFRKEWLAEIEERLAERRLYSERVFIERLNRSGVIEAILGPTKVDRLRRRYGLSVEDGLAIEIADDLLIDPISAVAPILQILLDRMWQQTRQHDHAVFSQKLYHELSRQGLLLADFLKLQLAKLAETQSESVDSGLALDLLAFHTTPLGTAEQHTLTEITRTYVHQTGVLKELLAAFRNLYLLVEPVDSGPNSEPISRLAHDTLAPIVRMRFDESDAPGQRARRIIESRIVGWRYGQDSSTLDDVDLALVESGRDGMRTWKKSETQLVEASRREKERREVEAKRVQRALKDAREREVEQEQEIARQSKARIRQQKWVIRVLSVVISVLLIWVGLRAYESLYFASSSWKRIAGRNFPDESVANAIAYTRSDNSSSGFLYCVATWMVGVGCSENGDTWNFYQQGFPTGIRSPASIGEFSGNMRGITALAFDALESSTMHAYALDGHFYSSDNWGQSWKSSIDALPKNFEVSVLIASGQTVLAVAHKLGEGKDERLYRSEDGGRTWRLEVDSDDVQIGRVYDVTFDSREEVISVASSTGVWQRSGENSDWTWQNSGIANDSRLLERLSDGNGDWALITYDSADDRSTLWLGSLSDPRAIAGWAGEPLRMTIAPQGVELHGDASPLVYVLLTDGDVIRIDTTEQVVRIGGLSHFLFVQPYDIAAAPSPDGEGLWLLLGHRSGLMLHKTEHMQK